MGSKRESPTKIDISRESQIKIKPKMSTASHLPLPQSGVETKEMLNASFSSLLKHLEPFSPSCRDARMDEKATPLKSQIFSPKTQLSASRLPLESLTSNVPLADRVRTPQRSYSAGRDDFWEALRSHYNYLMDEGLIATCREASDELSWEDGGDNQACCWTFTEFIQKFNELHDALHNLQSDVLAASQLIPNKTNAEIRKAVFEKLQLVVFGCKSFKEQAQQLGRRYPDMKDEINRRVNLLANKWEAVEQAINPHKPSLPKEDGVFQEIAQEMRCLRRWLRELESRLHPLSICPSWTLDELEEKYKEQQILQKEIESRGKFVSSLLKLCDQLGEGEVVCSIGHHRSGAVDHHYQGQQQPEAAHSAALHPDDQVASAARGGGDGLVKEDSLLGNEPVPAQEVNQQQLQSWDAERIRRLASNLEKRWHAIWLRSLEWQCIVEEHIHKYRSGKVGNSPLDFSFGEEPLHKYPRLSGDWDHTNLAARPKMTDLHLNPQDPDDLNLAIAPSPTFSSSSELADQGCDPVSFSQQHPGALTTDRGVMVGSTGIAQLKAQCGGSFGRFEIIQDVGYSSESSTQLSNDERSEFVRVYSYSPADHGRTLITEYRVNEDKLGRRNDQSEGGIPESTLGMNPNIMDWQFSSEDDHFRKHSNDGDSPRKPTQPFDTSTPLRNRDTHLPLKSVLEDSDLSDDEEWLQRHSRSETINLSELDVSGVTLVASEKDVDETDGYTIPSEVKKLVVKADQMVREESRKRTAESTTANKQPQQLQFGKSVKEHSQKSARVKEWLRDCLPANDEVVSGVDSTVEEEGLEEWPNGVSARSSPKKKPTGVVVDSSCDASGEYTTNDSDCEASSSADESQSQGDGLNESIALSRSGTGSVETVVPLGRFEDLTGVKNGEAGNASAPRVVLRSKKRGSRPAGDRPWSVTELHLLTSQFAASPFSTSEGALNTLIHSSSSSSVRAKLLRGSSLPKYRKSSQSSNPLSNQTSSSSHQTLPLRKSRRHRSRGSLHCSPTSPVAPSSIRDEATVTPLKTSGSGHTPPGTSTANTTDSGSDGRSPPFSGQSHSRSNQQSLSGSDSAQQSSAGGGITSTSSHKHSGGSSESKSSRRRRSSTGRRKSSPRTSVLGLERVKEVPVIESGLKLNTALPSSAQTTEDQSSVSDQVWDGYEDPPYWSEPYSEQTADEDQVKRLINFGDDYRAFIGSHSDTSSSAGGFKAGTSEGSIQPQFRARGGTVTSQDFHDDSDSDSDVEELQHVMTESLRALQFSESTLCQHKNAPPPSESAELLATCQTNLKCLQVIAEHLDTGLSLRNLSSEDLVHLQSLICGWEMLQSSVLSSQTNGQQYKDVQLEIASLRDKMADLALVTGSNCKPFTDVAHLEKSIATLQTSLSTLHETKATLLAVNLKVHRLLTEAGLTLSGLKDDVTDLYRRWDDVYEQSGSKLSELQEAHGTWQRFNQKRQNLFDLLNLEETSNTSLEINDLTNDPYRKLAERSSRANEAQELVIGLHQDSKTLEPYFGGSSAVWSEITRDLEEFGVRVNRLQKQVALACRRQSVVESPSDLGSSFTTQSSTFSSGDTSVVTRRLRNSFSEDKASPSSSSSSMPATEIPSARVSPQRKLPDATVSPTSATRDKAVAKGATKDPLAKVKSDSEVPPRRPRRSRFWRVVRAAIPIQMALVLLYCLAWLLEPHCCDVLNNMNFSFTPTLRYTRGPPPV